MFELRQAPSSGPFGALLVTRETSPKKRNQVKCSNLWESDSSESLFVKMIKVQVGKPAGGGSDMTWQREICVCNAIRVQVLHICHATNTSRTKKKKVLCKYRDTADTGTVSMRVPKS
jgi:hypothetical protein